MTFKDWWEQCEAYADSEGIDWTVQDYMYLYRELYEEGYTPRNAVEFVYTTSE